ncbi:transcriptional regulator [Bacillus thuringiensis serovar coreanensis]|uniref:helix-turn-helix domain-containing protein n=1 Tax=Bacillus cereus group TaxID=86661 RepID=UPI0007F0EF24|nr:helix-turn-helix transcriptional regulator [Bacillus cereus]ANN30741.1 transcriptional regulator [Bacillus thuringiensis serovar coreanensis]PEQ66924.1 transcriptional regulator [Bacillus cereus]
MKLDNEKLLKLIKDNNMRQVEFARALKLAPSTVSLYLSGKGQPGKKVLYCMSEFFGIPINEFFKKEKLSCNEVTKSKL